jgi:hypothetical protein
MRREPEFDIRRFAAFMSRCSMWFCGLRTMVNIEHFEIQNKCAYPMHVLCALKKLLHVKFDMTGLQLYTLVLEKTGKIVIHIRENHINRKRVL